MANAPLFLHPTRDASLRRGRTCPSRFSHLGEMQHFVGTGTARPNRRKASVYYCDRRSPKCQTIRSEWVKQTAPFVGATPCGRPSCISLEMHHSVAKPTHPNSEIRIPLGMRPIISPPPSFPFLLYIFKHHFR